MESVLENTVIELKDFVFNFHRDMVKHKITLVYEGEVTQEVTKAFTNLTQKSLEENEDSIPLQKRVYHVMVECLQNIGKHSDHWESGDPIIPGRGIFMVSRSNEGYAVTTGNIVANERVNEIRNRIDEVNGLDKDEIKELYKKKIVESRLSDKGGAGLGFIDIARKTGNQIEYHFEKVNEIASFFILRLEINKTK